MERELFVRHLAEQVSLGKIGGEDAFTLLIAFDQNLISLDFLEPPPEQDDKWEVALIAVLLLLGGSAGKRLSQRQRRKGRTLLSEQFDNRSSHLAFRVTSSSLTIDQWHDELYAAIATYSTTMAITGAGGMPKLAVRLLVEGEVKKQLPFLNRFALQVLTSRMLGEPMTAAAIGSRSILYGGTGWTSWFVGHESGPEVSGEGWVVYYHSRDDQGTCLVGDQRVLTTRGWVEIRDLQLGEQILTHDGSYHPIVALWQKPAHRIVSLATTYGELEVTEDHPVLVERQGRLQWRNAGQIGVGDVVFFQKGSEPPPRRIVHDQTLRQSFGTETRANGATSLRLITPLHSQSRMPILTVGIDDQVNDGYEKVTLY